MAEPPTTSNTPAYGAGLLDHHLPLEARRLRALEAFADPGSRAALDSCGLQAGWRCLEVGGGAGSVARWLAGRCAPGEVVATDLDISLLPKNVPNLTVLRHDVVGEDFPEASFDLVHTRALLEHLPEREDVLAKMVRWTAPGRWVCVEGVIVVTSTDGARNACHRCLDALVALADSMRADARWATAVPRLLAQAGLEDVGLRCTPGLVGPGGNANALLRLALSLTGPAMVARGFIQPQDLTDCTRLLDNARYTDLAFLSLSAWGRRPPA
ncbi:class I SAM-dependent methyltransferase [Streptomyces sp. NBC_01431]|uniref:class I SAM-dependent methyltransferase n=1 Tax=Streptomyces sp. NBC_01431 TaxID=2903863 RepID=UPI002E345A1E|nr:class I SAM-dependent methyltransferase [Streptomyces sp. NBC_01431]